MSTPEPPVTVADAWEGLDEARLRKVAEAATQAEWIAVTENRRRDSTPLLGVASRRGDGAHGCIAVFAGGGDLIRDRNANAEHCATFDPPTVLALLARTADLRAALAAAEARLADETAARRIAGDSADRFRDVVSECLGHEDENPGDNVLVSELREHFGRGGPEPTRWREFITGVRAQVDQINADRAALHRDPSETERDD